MTIIIVYKYNNKKLTNISINSAQSSFSEKVLN